MIAHIAKNVRFLSKETIWPCNLSQMLGVPLENIFSAKINQASSEHSNFELRKTVSVRRLPSCCISPLRLPIFRTNLLLRCSFRSCPLTRKLWTHFPNHVGLYVMVQKTQKDLAKAFHQDKLQSLQRWSQRWSHWRKQCQRTHRRKIRQLLWPASNSNEFPDFKLVLGLFRNWHLILFAIPKF